MEERKSYNNDYMMTSQSNLFNINERKGTKSQSCILDKNTNKVLSTSLSKNQKSRNKTKCESNPFINKTVNRLIYHIGVSRSKSKFDR